ncbi:hypothetical protein VT99_12652 [Candidatus Electrothrix marina]|uniref:Uncharacterized protein n=1 Tax=Candidatus Electrothrix marina TaxID=1859130 RepID=A0A3S4T8X7_9BACT|nr:hypothetical protein VT99_12652 [Candidatus Electrothrix marina]
MLTRETQLAIKPQQGGKCNRNSKEEGGDSRKLSPGRAGAVAGEKKRLRQQKLLKLTAHTMI